MERLLIFILCTSSISWIIVNSKLFQPIREAITTKRIKTQIELSNSITKMFYWYLDGLFGCVGCMGVYSGFFSYCILYKTFSVEIIAYSLSGAMASLLMVRLTKK